MKNIINKNKILILFSILTLTGCSEITELENLNKINQEGFYRDQTELNLALNGCYNTLRAPIAFEWMLTEVRSDNTFMNNTGSTNAQNLQIYANDVFQAPTFDFFIQNYWSLSYQSIRSINSLLTGLYTSYNPATGVIDYSAGFTAPVSDALRKQMAGEASFMRAYHYFNLVRTFGNIFLLDKLVGPEEALSLKQSPQADVYKLIVADLKNAAANCKATKYTSLAAADKGRVSSWAAKSLLAKVYLTLGQKTEAATLLKDVIDNSGHSLLTGTGAYSNVFSATNELNAEIVFAIGFKSGALGYGSSLSNLFATNTTSISNQTKLVVPAGTRGAYNNPTEDLYNSYALTDVRRDYNIKVYKPTDASLPAEWTYWAAKHNIAVSVANDSELDWPVLRFSDVLLMYCEAIGAPNTTTLDYLNKVHTRAGLTAINPAAGAAYEKAVADERRWEFALENQRWFDLQRFGTTFTTISAKAVMKSHFTAMLPFYSLYDDAPADSAILEARLFGNVENSKFNFSPIPNYEIITGTRTPITQNPGY